MSVTYRALDDSVEVCHVWNNGALADSTCRLLRTKNGHYYLYRGSWPRKPGETAVLRVVPASVAIEMRRLVVALAEAAL